MKVQVDPALCQGHARCYSLAPGVFVLDDEGYAHVSADGELPAELEVAAQRAAANCPEHAISIVLSPT